MRKLIALLLCLVLTPVYGAGSKNFNGTNDFVTVPDSASINPDQFSISIWVNPTDFVDHRNPIWKAKVSGGAGAQYGIIIFATGVWQGQDNTAPDVIGGTLSLNTWHHLVYTHDGTNRVAYQDGVLQNADATGGILKFTEALYIGSDEDNNRRYEGLITDFRLYNRILSADEVLIAMECMNQPIQGLVGQWNLMNDDNAYQDLSGNGNDGTCSNCPDNSGDGPPTAWCES